MNPPHMYEDKEKIVLSKDGVWLTDGEEITHQATCQGFSRNLKRDADGYFIEIGRDKKRIEIEDTAYFVVRLEGDPKMGYEAVLSDGSMVGLDPGSLKYKPGRLTCRVATAIGEEEAKFLRAPYFEILSFLEEDEQGYFLNFAGSRIQLAKK
jgi:hypothetical protein